MGGTGSGSYFGWQKKATTDDLIQIDVREWNQALLRSNFHFSRSWQISGEQRFRLSIEGAGEILWLRYTSESLGQPDKKGEVNVHLAFTPCNFGGERPWLLCPNLLCPRQRVAKLYFGASGFLCRNCYQLTYPSQQGGPEDRALRQLHKINTRLGMAGGLPDSALPQRPKRMRKRTYALLEEKRQKNLQRLRSAAQRLSSGSDPARERATKG